MSIMLVFLIVILCIILMVFSYFAGKAVERVRLEEDTWCRGFKTGETAGRMAAKYEFCKEHVKKGRNQKE